MKCPICEKGNLKKGKSKEYLYGIYLGEYPAESCTECGEILIDSVNMKKIEAKAKELGIWGLGKKTKITKTGNSVAIRIPKEIVDFLKLEVGEEAFIHPDKDKIVIETVAKA